jgi:hypothetical protein
MAKGQQRDPKREAFWRGVLGRFGKSGLSVRGFCRREKLSEPSFYAWRSVIRERDAERRPREVHRRRPRRESAPAFVPIVVRDEPAARDDGAITVQWPGGRSLRLPLTIKAERLAELVRTMEAEA